MVGLGVGTTDDCGRLSALLADFGVSAAECCLITVPGLDFAVGGLLPIGV